MKVDIRVQPQDFDVSTELAAQRSAAQVDAGGRGIGAVASFVGVVRDSNDGDSVATLELEHYPGMTEKSIAAIVEQAAARWPLSAVTVIHRVGRLLPGDQIVLVAVAGSHRGETFAACEYIMDFLKTRAPFWKKELTPEGERWVDARVSDESAAARWS